MMLDEFAYNISCAVGNIVVGDDEFRRLSLSLGRCYNLLVNLESEILLREKLPRVHFAPCVPPINNSFLRIR